MMILLKLSMWSCKEAPLLKIGLQVLFLFLFSFFFQKKERKKHFSEQKIIDLQFYQIDYDYPGVSGAQVHSGFYKSSKSLFDNMRTKFKGLLDSKPGYKVVVTGHSNLLFFSFFFFSSNSISINRPRWSNWNNGCINDS